MVAAAPLADAVERVGLRPRPPLNRVCMPCTTGSVRPGGSGTGGWSLAPAPPGHVCGTNPSCFSLSDRCAEVEARGEGNRTLSPCKGEPARWMPPWLQPPHSRRSRSGRPPVFTRSRRTRRVRRQVCSPLRQRRASIRLGGQQCSRRCRQVRGGGISAHPKLRRSAGERSRNRGAALRGMPRRHRHRRALK